MALQLKRVAVDSLALPGRRGPESLEALLEPAAPALENPHPDVGLREAEEGEVHAEAVVLPGRRARLPEQVVQPLLAVSRQPVDDLGAARAVQCLASFGNRVLGHEPLAEHVLECRVERAVTERAERAEQ